MTAHILAAYSRDPDTCGSVQLCERLHGVLSRGWPSCSLFWFVVTIISMHCAASIFRMEMCYPNITVHGVTITLCYATPTASSSGIFSAPPSTTWSSKECCVINPSCMDWVRYVLRRAVFLIRSDWYRETIVPIFLFVHFRPTDATQSLFDTHTHTHTHIYIYIYIAFYVLYVFFQMYPC
jgi:hypothetical protein